MNKRKPGVLLVAASLAVASAAFAAQKVVLGTLVKMEGKHTLVLKDRLGVGAKYQTTAKTEKVGGDPAVGSIVELYLGDNGKVEKLEWMRQ